MNDIKTSEQALTSRSKRGKFVMVCGVQTAYIRKLSENPLNDSTKIKPTVSTRKFIQFRLGLPEVQAKKIVQACGAHEFDRWGNKIM